MIEQKPPPNISARQKQCDEDFERYDKERGAVVTAEREAEKNYDTLLVTLSTLAIGSSFTLFRDMAKSTAGSALLLLSWVAFGVCLFSALVDRLYTYQTHTRWRETMDAEFAHWREGAWERALTAYVKIPLIQVLPRLKWVGFWSLLAGVVFLMGYVYLGLSNVAPMGASAAPSPVVVNVYAAGTSTPATQPVAVNNFDNTQVLTTETSKVKNDGSPPTASIRQTDSHNGAPIRPTPATSALATPTTPTTNVAQIPTGNTKTSKE